MTRTALLAEQRRARIPFQVDVDGDGHVDEYEMKVSRSIRRKFGRTSPETTEKEKERQMIWAKKRIIEDSLRDFRGRLCELCTNNKKPDSPKNLKFQNDEEVIESLTRSDYFGRAVDTLRQRGRAVQLSSSKEVREAFQQAPQQWDELMAGMRDEQKQHKNNMYAAARQKVQEKQWWQHHPKHHQRQG